MNSYPGRAPFGSVFQRFQQLLQLAFPENGDALLLQQPGGDPVPRDQAAGKAAVVDLPPAAAGAALLEQRLPAAKQPGQPQGFFGTFPVGGGDVGAGFGHHPLPLPLAGGAGSGQAAQDLGAHRHQPQPGQGIQQGLAGHAAAVVPAAYPQQTGAYKNGFQNDPSFL